MERKTGRYILSLKLNCVLCSLGAMVLFGCSSFFKSSEINPNDFKSKIAPVNQTRPLPVEIAQDIAEISENGTIRFKQENEELSTRVDVLEGRIKPKFKRILEEAPVNDVFKEESLRVAATNNLIAEKKSPGPIGKALRRRLNPRGPLSITKNLVRRGRRGKKGRSNFDYIVRLGDTLMKIAFDVHGNFLRWREIYRENRDKMVHYRKMPVGVELDISNVKSVYIRKKGIPYIIQKSDSLKSISEKIYGTSEKWPLLWKNNPQLIRQPGRIYAGFTLYYEQDSFLEGGQESKDRALSSEDPLPPKEPDQVQ